MFNITPPTRWKIHDLGELSNVSIDGRPETVFFANDGTQVDCFDHRHKEDAESLANTLNSRSRARVLAWIENNKNFR